MNKALTLFLIFSVALLAAVVWAGTEAPAAPTDPQVPTTRPGVLDAKIDELQLDSASLDAAIDKLRDLTHANLFVEWARLKEVGIDRSAAVRVRLWGVTLAKALAIVLADVDDRLAFQEQDGVVTVSTAERLATKTVVRIYDIRPLVEFLATRVAPNEAVSRQEIVDTVTKMIEDTIDTESWKDNGGSVGSLREILGLLVVEQLPSNQKRVQDLLEELQTGRGPHVVRLGASAAQPAR